MVNEFLGFTVITSRWPIMVTRKFKVRPTPGLLPKVLYRPGSHGPMFKPQKRDANAAVHTLIKPNGDLLS